MKTTNFDTQSGTVAAAANMTAINLKMLRVMEYL